MPWEKIKQKLNWLNISIFIFVAFLMLFAYFAEKEGEFWKEKKAPPKVVQIDNLQVRGYDKENIAWNLVSKEAWSAKFKDSVNLENVIDGNIYDKEGKKKVTNFKAAHILVDLNSFDVTADKAISADLFSKENKEPVFITAQNLQYYNSSKISRLSGEIKLKRGNTSLTTAYLTVDHENDYAYFPNSFKLYQGRTSITADIMEAYLKEDRAVLNGHVKLFRKGKKIKAPKISKKQKNAQDKKNKNLEEIWEGENLRMLCNRMIIDTKTKDVIVYGAIKIVQPKRTIFGEEGLYKDKERVVSLTSPTFVRFIQENFNALGKHLLAELKKDHLVIEDNVKLTRTRPKKIKKALDPREIALKKEKTTLFCNYLEFFPADKNAKIKSGVHVLQPGKDITADSAFYEEKNKSLTLTDNVNFKSKSASWMLREETKKRIKNPEAKKSLEKETITKCNQMTLFVDSLDAKMKDNVQVTQNKKNVKSDEAYYRDKDESITLTGNALAQKDDGSWLKSAKIVVWVAKEKVEAQEAESEFKIQKK